MLVLLNSCSNPSTPGLVFEATSDLGNYEVVDYTGADEEVFIPDQYNGFDVIGIAEDAFKGKNITKVHIKKNLKYINNYAFYNNAFLEEVVFENNSQLEKIGNYAFAYDELLSEITLPNKLKEIGFYAFKNVKLITKLDLPESLITINGNAFEGMESLVSIRIPKNIETIGESGFYDMEALESIEVDNLNNNYMSKNGVLYSKNGEILICYPQNKKDAEFTIPNEVKTILSNAIYNWNLEVLNIEHKMELIEFGAVYGYKLREIYILAYIDVIEKYGFLKSPVDATIYVYLQMKPVEWGNYTSSILNDGWNGKINVVWNYSKQ